MGKRAEAGQAPFRGVGLVGLAQDHGASACLKSFLFIPPVKVLTFIKYQEGGTEGALDSSLPLSPRATSSREGSHNRNYTALEGL